MRAPKFTPGPWAAGKPFYHYSERQKVTPIHANDPGCVGGMRLVAWCHQNAVPAKQVVANARLITAAPDLYEALAELLRVDDEWHGAVNSEMSVARSKARAALAMARGETP